MEYSISAAEANRNFFELLRAVRDDGASYVITSHGKPVARIVPAGQHEAGTATAREVLLRRLARQPVTEIGRWSRDELYDDAV